MTAIIEPINCAIVRHTGTVKGRGVFATRLIHQGELIEACPVVVFQTRYVDMPKEFQQLVFNWGELTKSGPATCLALGWGSQYNHNNPANVRYRADAVNRLMIFTAAREIQPGEELTINYNETLGEIESIEDSWFDVTGITPLE